MMHHQQVADQAAALLDILYLVIHIIQETLTDIFMLEQVEEVLATANRKAALHQVV
jgi:hypothetical protein